MYNRGIRILVQTLVYIGWEAKDEATKLGTDQESHANLGEVEGANGTRADCGGDRHTARRGALAPDHLQAAEVDLRQIRVCLI